MLVPQEVLFESDFGTPTKFTKRAPEPAAPYLKTQQQPPDGVPSLLGAGATATLNLALEALLPFDGCPECVVTFTTRGATHRYPLRLPVVAPCFCEPVALSAEDFNARWAALAPSNTDDPACPREQVRVGNSWNSEYILGILVAVFNSLGIRLKEFQWAQAHCPQGSSIASTARCNDHMDQNDHLSN